MSSQLQKLRELSDAEPEKAEAIWKIIAKRAKWFVLAPETQPIIETLDGKRGRNIRTMSAFFNP